ncbi:MAG TPA: AAA family ATPase [Candidatus Kryptonia bacterium]|nr:AAA family ATPase [Candidatus Kryptonia bacterium]
MSLPPLIVAMLRPEFYPHDPATVTLVQTHISYVLLAGDEVYKIKKPVRFTFLDFSTLERRKHFCHEEVRLNRRLAADIYRGVVTICRDGDHYRLGSADERGALEYAVHMRRLPDDRLLDHLLDRGAVTREMIEQVAVRLVEFHRDADAGAAVTANGDPAAIRRILEDNYNGVRPFREVTIAAADDDAIQAFSAAFLRRNEPLFRRRQAQHRIRDGHGDLHSEHVCFSDGLVIFDCIEFNRQFRYCDVASEIAFLAMDLEFHGRADLASHLIASYAARAGDAELPRLMGFYRCYRAYVRGKVDSLKSRETEVNESERSEARASAERHFALAYRYTWVDQACVIAICGLSGAGKSVIAALLHERTGYRHVNSDVVRKQLAGVAPATRRTAQYDEGIYTAEHSAATYRAMFELVGEELAAGRGSIVDATFQRRSDRDALRAVAARRRVPLLFVECRCSEAEIRRRIERRVGEAGTVSDADWNVYVAQRDRFEAFTPAEARDRMTIDSSRGPEVEAREIEAEARTRWFSSADEER